MADSNKRPASRRCNFETFLQMAKEHRGSETDARNVWMRLVEVVRNAKYNPNNAAAETLTYGQFVTVVEHGREQFRGMSDSRWLLARKVAARLREEFSGDTMRKHEDLYRFIQARGDDTRKAMRIWTILLRDGLEIWTSDTEKQLFSVPDSIIFMIAEANPEAHRNLGVGLSQILRDWCKTF